VCLERQRTDCACDAMRCLSPGTCEQDREGCVAAEERGKRKQAQELDQWYINSKSPLIPLRNPTAQGPLRSPASGMELRSSAPEIFGFCGADQTVKWPSRPMAGCIDQNLLQLAVGESHMKFRLCSHGASSATGLASGFLNNQRWNFQHAQPQSGSYLVISLNRRKSGQGI